MRICNILVSFCMLILVSCGDDNGSSAKENRSRILDSPEFAGITDSIRKNPENPGLLIQRAVRLSQKNFHEMATADFKKSWELTGDPGMGLEYVSNLLLTGKEKEAIDLLNDGIDRFPGHPDYKRRLAEVYAQSGNSRKAISIYEELLSEDPQNFEAWYNLGVLQAEIRDTASAIQSLQRSYEIIPLNHSGLSLANMLITRKDPDALRIVNEIIARDSEGLVTDALLLKGIYYSETGNKAQALEIFEECIRRDWKMSDAYIEKGIVQFEQNNYKEALETFTMAATVSNTYADAYFWMGRSHEAMNNFVDAIENYQRALSLDETFIEARNRIRKLTARIKE